MSVSQHLLHHLHQSTLLITVGTTHFDALIDHIFRSSTIVPSIRCAGVDHIEVQLGSTSQYTATHPPDCSAFQHKVRVSRKEEEIENDEFVTFHNLVPSLTPLMQQASMVIAHAGAGSILEALRMRKRVLVVINEQLMDNHQMEVAIALAHRHYVYACRVQDVEPAVLCLCRAAQPQAKARQNSCDKKEDEEDKEEEEKEEEEKDDDDVLRNWSYPLLTYPPPSPSSFARVIAEEMER